MQPAPAQTGAAKVANKRGAARLAAVQALYQMEQTEQSARSVVADFMEDRLGLNDEGEPVEEADPDIFKSIVLGVVDRQEAIDAAIALNTRLVEACQKIIDDSGIPAHTVQFGAKGCITWSIDPVRNYRDYKRTDFGAAELSWLWGVNRGILTPPGLDEQWLVSLAHTRADMDLLVGDFRELAVALRA